MSPAEFMRRTGLEFNDLSLLRRALTHRSYVNENPESLEDNERLEYLGDAALDFLSAAWLFKRFPEMDEGELTRLRSALVRTEQLAQFANEIELGQVLYLGKGEESSGGRTRPALLCDAFESLIGAMVMDSGIEFVEKFMEPRFTRAVEKILEEESLLDARSSLQMWAQAEFGETPRYKTLEAFGPDHAREFIVEVTVGKYICAKGHGHSKQEAAHRAAEVALSEILAGKTGTRRDG